MKIYKNILSAISLIAVLQTGLFSSAANAKNTKKVISKETLKEKIEDLFVKDYDTDLLNSLAQIETDLKNRHLSAVYEKSAEIADYLDHYKNQAEKHKAENVQLSEKYKGDKILELKYGNWFNSKKMILPLNPRTSAFSFDSLKDRIVLSAYFAKNEINDASVEYVTYTTDSDKFRLDLHKLLSGIEERNSNYIRESINNIYSDMFVYHSIDISLVPKIRDSLVVARYLIDSSQFKAAKNIVGVTDGLALRLIEATSNSPAEQRRIKELRNELNSISKVSDANYISEWEKIPEGIENFWKKNN